MFGPTIDTSNWASVALFERFFGNLYSAVAPFLNNSMEVVSPTLSGIMFTYGIG